jgi:hypothetical protein
LAGLWRDKAAGVIVERGDGDVASIETVRWTELRGGMGAEAKYLDKGKALHYNASQAITG